MSEMFRSFENLNRQSLNLLLLTVQCVVLLQVNRLSPSFDVELKFMVCSIVFWIRLGYQLVAHYTVERGQFFFCFAVDVFLGQIMLELWEYNQSLLTWFVQWQQLFKGLCSLLSYIRICFRTQNIFKLYTYLNIQTFICTVRLSSSIYVVF